MKILHLVFHPNLNHSRVNRIWQQQLVASGKITTSRDMYAEVPNFTFDVAHEQQYLRDHDRIVLQFPFYWYSSPPLLKKWLDDVLTYGFAYGSTGTELTGKDLQIITSAGGQPRHYTGFSIYATIPQLLQPFHLTANLCGMNYMMPVWMYHADTAAEETIRKQGDTWVGMIDDPRRSDAKAFLESGVNEVLTA